MKCGNGIDARQVNELSINIDPIQAGGKLTGDCDKSDHRVRGRLLGLRQLQETQPPRLYCKAADCAVP